LLHGRFLLFNPAHYGHARPHVQVSGEPVQQSWCAHGVDTDGAIGFIAYPTGQAQLNGSRINELAKPNTLHPPGNHPAPGFLATLLRLVQWTMFSGA
jgi:hypothetical protein